MRRTQEQKRMIHNIRKNVAAMADLVPGQYRHRCRLARQRRKRVDAILKGLRRTIERPEGEAE